MANHGKSINLFLMDGTPNGIIKCSLANWTGVAYKIPRTELEKCKEREELSQSGIYFLFGKSEQNDEQVVYIGQAGVRKTGDGILYRLQEHKRNPDKDYWTEAIVFTTSNNSFGPTEISYLEHRFCKIANEAKRYFVKNANEPSLGNITEEKECELEEFIDYAKIIVGTLGHNLFEPLIKNVLSNDNKKDLKMFYIKRKSKVGTFIDARGIQTNEGFVVLKGSTINLKETPSLQNNVKKFRKEINIDSNGILQEDVLFSSPSYAACLVLGRSANGLIEWKNKDGKILKEIENS